MARFYRVQIENIYLTKDGTLAGRPCMLAISNVEDLLAPVAGTAVTAADGSAIFQLVPWSAGKQFEIQVETLTESVWEDLKELLLDSLQNETDLTIVGTGDIGDFSVSARPFPQKPFSAAGFINGRIRNAVLRFITV